MDNSDIKICGALLRGGSRSFHAASLLLPKRIREPATAVYAFCRLADDAIDGSGDSKAALAILRDRLDRIYRGSPAAIPADRAFAAVVEHFSIPRALPEALLEGFQWDAENRRYETLDDLRAYAVRVAGTVGAMMALLMGRRDSAALSRAMDLGVAMQLTNIARDVGEDARAGRLYLPQRWMRQARIDPDRFIRHPQFNDDLGSVVKRVLRAAQGLYDRSAPGIALLPISCRPAIHAAHLFYAEIGNQVRRNGHDSVARRAVVGLPRKLLLLGQANARAFSVAKPLGHAPLPEAKLLIHVSAASGSARMARTSESVSLSWWRLGARWSRAIELFQRLEQRGQLNQANS